MGTLLGEPGGVKEGSGNGHLFPWGASLGNLGEGSYARGLCMEESSGMVVSPYMGPVGGPWEGVRLLGALRDG
jgi:hypothetical protein